MEEKGFMAHLPLSPSGLSDFLLLKAVSVGELDQREIKHITENYISSINPKHLSAIMAKLDFLFSESDNK